MSYPARIDRYLDLMQDGDDEVSHEATLALRFLIEKFCITGGDQDWLANVNAFLRPQPCLAARGAEPLADLDMDPQQIAAVAREIFARLQAGAQPAWRHAYALRQALNPHMPTAEIAAYIRENWRKDEAVALHLTNAVWSTDVDATLLPVYDAMAEEAQEEALRTYALQHAKILRTLDGNS